MAYVGALVGAVAGYAMPGMNPYGGWPLTEEELKAEAKKLAGYLSKLSGQPTSQKAQLQQLAGKLDPEAKQAAMNVQQQEAAYLQAKAAWTAKAKLEQKAFESLTGIPPMAGAPPPPPEPDRSYDINDLSPVSRARIAALKEEE